MRFKRQVCVTRKMLLLVRINALVTIDWCGKTIFRFAWFYLLSEVKTWFTPVRSAFQTHARRASNSTVPPDRAVATATVATVALTTATASNCNWWMTHHGEGKFAFPVFLALHVQFVWRYFLVKLAYPQKKAWFGIFFSRVVHCQLTHLLHSALSLARRLHAREKRAPQYDAHSHLIHTKNFCTSIVPSEHRLRCEKNGKKIKLLLSVTCVARSRPGELPNCKKTILNAEEFFVFRPLLFRSYATVNCVWLVLDDRKNSLCDIHHRKRPNWFY